MCDTTEMADPLNQRIHNERVDAHAPTVAAARDIGSVSVTSSLTGATIPPSTYATPMPLLDRWIRFAIATDGV